MVPPEVESWRVDAPTRPCAFCRSTVEGEKCTTCPRCATVYHPDCWASNSRRCAVYGCEPGRTPAGILTRPVRPILQPPELPRSGVNWTWLTPFAAVIVMQLARVGMDSNRPAPPPPPAPQFLRQGLWSDLDSHVPGPVLPAPPREVPALIEEADGIVNSVSALTSMPAGRLTDDVRRMLRETVTADLAALRQALQIYRRCAAAQPDEALRTRIDRIRWLIVRKRGLLLDLTRSRGPD